MKRLSHQILKPTPNNANIFAALELKASEQPDKFGEPLNKAKAVKQLSDDYYSYLETLKNRMTEKLSDKSDYEVMDKADFLDQTFFKEEIILPKEKNLLIKSMRIERVF